MKRPWRREELDALLPVLKSRIEAAEAERPDIRPVPPMTSAEALDYGRRLIDVAATRPLTDDECFLHGQIMAVLVMAVQAETRGYRGRFLVVSEDDLTRAMNGD